MKCETVPTFQSGFRPLKSVGAKSLLECKAVSSPSLQKLELEVPLEAVSNDGPR